MESEHKLAAIIISGLIVFFTVLAILSTWADINKQNTNRTAIENGYEQILENNIPLWRKK